MLSRNLIGFPQTVWCAFARVAPPCTSALGTPTASKTLPSSLVGSLTTSSYRTRMTVARLLINSAATFAAIHSRLTLYNATRRLGSNRGVQARDPRSIVTYSTAHATCRQERERQDRDIAGVVKALGQPCEYLDALRLAACSTPQHRRPERALPERPTAAAELVVTNPAGPNVPQLTNRYHVWGLRDQALQERAFAAPEANYVYDGRETVWLCSTHGAGR
jgi:hypothetical protein